MATIAQMVEYMNGINAEWHPKQLVEVEYTEEKLPGYETQEHGIIENQEDGDLYVRHGYQKFIGHYYISHSAINHKAGVILLPLNNGKYLKSNFIIKQP